MNFNVRKVAKSDIKNLIALYKKATTIPEGLARTPQEITEKHITEIVEQAIKNGIGLVVENFEETANPKIVGTLITSKPEPLVFKHTLSNMTMAVDPDFFGHKIGKILFTNLTQEILNNRPDIARAELHVRQTNKLAIKIYESVGFKLEGILKNRALDSKGQLSDDSIMTWFNTNFKL